MVTSPVVINYKAKEPDIKFNNNETFIYMKQKFTRFMVITSTVLFIGSSIQGQAPEKMSYQAVVRNSDGQLITNHEVGMKVSILQGSPAGMPVYQEIYNPNPQTNINGLVSIEIGGGIPLAGSFTNIDWSAGPYFLKTETDPAGGTSYSITGTTELITVPYAFHAKKAATYDETDPVFGLSPSGGITNINISNWNTAYSWGDHALADYVPQKRNININGTTYDLAVDRAWSVGTVTSVGLSLPGIFLVTGTPITGSGTLTASLVSQAANRIFASPSGGSGAPSFRALVAADIPNLDWSKITTGRPSTLTGYGITDGVSTTGNQTINGNKTFTGTTTVAAPVNAMDAATKAYVDALIEDLYAQGALRVRDYDGNYYNTVKIGTQVWLAENLRTTHFNNGTAIPLVTDNAAWNALVTPGYCFYNNDQATYGGVYGPLYNWYTVDAGNLCPSGWHVPSYAEQTTLISFLGGTSVAGGKIKETGTTHWSDPNTGATNESGYTGLPGGWRYDAGGFTNVGYSGSWWTSTQLALATAYTLFVSYNSAGVTAGSNADKNMGRSVRCIKD